MMLERSRASTEPTNARVGTVVKVEAKTGVNAIVAMMHATRTQLLFVVAAVVFIDEGRTVQGSEQFMH
jgi:hypothetical protein